MKPTIAFMFIGVLIAPMASAGQPKPLEWKEVQNLKPGTEIALLIKTGDTLNVYLLFADETLLVTLKFTPVTKLKRFEQFLVGIGPRWLDILGNPDYKVEQGALRVSQDGLFDGDKKLADLAELVEQTPRAYVIEVLEATIPKPASLLGLDIFAAGLRLDRPTDSGDGQPEGPWAPWGWEVGATVRLFRWLGITGAFGRGDPIENLPTYHLVAGPRFTTSYETSYGFRGFGHALVGFAQSDGGTSSQTSAEVVLGAGFDVFWLLRVQGDYVRMNVSGLQDKNYGRVYVGGVVALCFRACREYDQDGLNLSGRKAQ